MVKKSEIGPGSAEAEKEAPGAPRSRTVDRMEEVIEHGLTGSEKGIQFDIERLSYEIERTPESVARQMVRRADNLTSLKRIVQDVGRFLRERLAQPFIQQGKDFSRPVSRLAKEFKKVVESFETPEDFSGSVKELVSVLEQCAEAVKLELIVKTFQESGGDAKSLARIKSKFLTSKDARDRILEPLKERLLGLGLGESEFEKAFTVEEKPAPKKPGGGDAPAQELAELRQLKERYEQEIKSLRGELQRARGHKERLENVIGSLAEGLVVVDNEGKIQMLNPAAEKLLGMEQGQGLGVPVGQSLKAEHIVALTKGPLLEDANEVTKDIEVRSMDDETRKILRASSAVIEDEQGETVGMVAVLSDATAQKKMEELNERLEVLTKTLERRVQEQVTQLERLSRLKRFFSPQLAELIVAGGADDPLKTHRRAVTVVFLDLRGFTAFAETSEPEEVMGVLHEYHNEMGKLILDYEGTLERFAGDGMMVFFNDPVPVPDPEERALRMAVAMRERVGHFAVRWRKRGYELDFGAGIAQGYATIGAIGFEGRWDYGAIGTVTNLASRLCDAARPGQILVSQRFLSAVEDLVESEPVGKLELRGFHRPVTTYNIVGLKSGIGSGAT